MDYEDPSHKLNSQLQKRRPIYYASGQPRNLEELRIVEAYKQGQRALNYIPTKETSPWDAYEKICFLKLGDKPVVIAEKRGISRDVVAISSLEEAQVQAKADMVKSIQHPNFVTVHELYRFEGQYHTVSEYMPRSLQEVIGNPFLNDSRLAAIIGQIVEGLDVLEKRGLQHRELTCSQVLIHPSGNVKIYGYEYIENLHSANKNIQDLGYIMMELMQGYAKEGPHVGLDDPDRWSVDTVNFLSATTSATSVDELKKACLFLEMKNRLLTKL
ncbi:hypothetical protein CEP51_015453 [Fusarium floridanum]|uniref:cyclin-dependent kinase n=1 Tax=Fusarium floridanum TaxID=1325733 RepID=A0A428P9J6_9HYPO|nr:hypothetical protein CEP51_015453 [Fusarium floridanum]